MPKETPISRKNTAVRSITGQQLALRGWLDLVIELDGGAQLMITGAVVKDSTMLILGMPFLKQVKAVLFIWENEIRISGRLYPLVKRHISNGGCCTAVEIDADVLEILDSFPEVCSESKIGRTEVVQHEINLLSPKPICDRPRKYALWQQEIIDTEVNKMLDSGVIRPSQSPYAAAVVLVKKKTGDWRFCVDYKNLNSITMRDRHPLPRIKDLIHTVKESRFFITLDLKAGYWQVKMRAEDIQKTAFRTHRGLYEFLVMPFGLTNAPATFQRLMETLFGEYRWDGVLLYLDDILIHSATRVGALQLLRIVLSKLRSAGLTINPAKCEFFPEQIHYLGHILSRDGMRPNPRKIEAIRALKPPRDIKGLQRILGMFTYYREFIPHFAEYCEPLLELLRGKKVFNWLAPQEEALETLKMKLSDEVLTIPLDNEDFLLETDASDYAISGILSVRRDGKYLPVEMGSHTLSGPQRRWPIREKEAYAIVWFLERFQEYFRGRAIRVHTDHHSLKWFLQAKKGKLARWAQKLAEFDLDIYYKKGADLVHVDCLTRNPEDDDPIQDRMVFSATPSDTLSGDSYSEDSDSFEEGSSLEESDQSDHSSSDQESGCADTSGPSIVPSFVALPTIEELQNWLSIHPLPDNVLEEDGVPTYRDKLFVPEEMRERILNYFHSNLTGHGGIFRTTAKIRKIFDWPYMKQDVESYIKSCIICGRIRSGTESRHGLIRTNPEPAPFEVVHIDLWGPVKMDGLTAHLVLTIIDKSTRWAAAITLKSKKSRIIISHFISQWCCKYGFPSKVISDQESCFKAAEFQEVLSSLGVRGVQSTVYHPQGNSPIETFHRSLRSRVMSILDINEHLAFDEVIQLALFGYNTSVHSATQETPSFLVYGLDICFPPERHWSYLHRGPLKNRLKILSRIRLNAMHHTSLLADRNQARVNEHRRHIEVEVGTLVLIRANAEESQKPRYRSKKLRHKWGTPCRVVSVNSSGSKVIVWDPLAQSLKEAHIGNLRFIHWPKSLIQQEEWFEQIRNELQQTVGEEDLEKRVEDILEELEGGVKSSSMPHTSPFDIIEGNSSPQMDRKRSPISRDSSAQKRRRVIGPTGSMDQTVVLKYDEDG